MSKEFTKSYAINRIAELNEQIVEMTAEQSETMRYLNKLRDNNKQLKQQLEEKDKEIEKLKQQYTILENENGKLTTELIMGKYKKAQKEVSFGKQLAIQELEKLRDKVVESSEKIVDTVECIQDFHSGITLGRFKRIIDQQIKELKGE